MKILKIFSLISVLIVLPIIYIGCSEGMMEVVPMKVKIEISRDISWADDPTILIGAESAYMEGKELIMEGPFVIGSKKRGYGYWIGKMFIRDNKLIIPITEKVRVKISS